jgi:hypothetical protein
MDLPCSFLGEPFLFNLQLLSLHHILHVHHLRVWSERTRFWWTTLRGAVWCR